MALYINKCRIARLFSWVRYATVARVAVVITGKNK